MRFYDLSSIISAQKEPIAPLQPTESFSVVATRPEPYIEPSFDKIEFHGEKPTIILVSAVGATGKTTLARVLSRDTGLPLLDLAKHKAVGDKTITGLLTDTFLVEDLSKVFQKISEGKFGIVIDGIDEGRSKTSEKAFEAFLDDIARRCRGAHNTSFVLLGRTQALEDCWVYLTDKGMSTGLVAIRPFDMDQAREYIDKFTGGPLSGHSDQYRVIRDVILQRLGAVFADGGRDEGQSFLSFIGYPPVLDAIVTLLQEEKNYHRLHEELRGGDVEGVEIGLLYRIATYILGREKHEKVVPNILSDLIKGMPESDQSEISAAVYEPEEQCLRLTSYRLDKPLGMSPIGRPALDREYDDRLRPFLPEHPFIARRQFRNAVFEAVALSSVMLSPRADSIQLALEYFQSHKHNYHLVYLLHQMASGREIPIDLLRVVIGSALEFRSRTASVEISIDGDGDDDPDRTVYTEIEIVMGMTEGQAKRFAFQSRIRGADSINLGDKLSSTFVSLPCAVSLSGAEEIELTAPVGVFATKIDLGAHSLVLRAPSSDPDQKFVLLSADSLASTVGRVTPNGAELVIGLVDRTGITYPIIEYVEDNPRFTHDVLLKEKYLRLRRILVNFRSHSRGRLARYKAKIENERVVRNEQGWAILQRLLKDKIISLEGEFYFLQPDSVHHHLGVSWVDLRKGATSEKLEQYLKSIN